MKLPQTGQKQGATERPQAAPGIRVFRRLRAFTFTPFALPVGLLAAKLLLLFEQGLLLLALLFQAFASFFRLLAGFFLLLFERGVVHPAVDDAADGDFLNDLNSGVRLNTNHGPVLPDHSSLDGLAIAQQHGVRPQQTGKEEQSQTGDQEKPHISYTEPIDGRTKKEGNSRVNP